MSIKYLYYTEGISTGGVLSAAFAVPFLDQVLLMYGGERMCIHPDGAEYGASAPESYPTLAAAQAAYSNHTWIYLCQSGSQCLDELVHPVDNVVYVVGHDLTGYGVDNPSKRYKLRVVPPDFEGHAIVCLSMAAIDRWMRLAPWQ